MEEGIYFKPWVGPKYHEGIDGKKVMVLGHCHYCDDGSADEEFTNCFLCKGLHKEPYVKS